MYEVLIEYAFLQWIQLYILPYKFQKLCMNYHIFYVILAARPEDTTLLIKSMYRYKAFSNNITAAGINFSTIFIVTIFLSLIIWFFGE